MDDKKQKKETKMCEKKLRRKRTTRVCETKERTSRERERVRVRVKDDILVQVACIQ